MWSSDTDGRRADSREDLVSRPISDSRPVPPPRDGDLLFGPFRVDLAGQRVWNGARADSPRSKSWQVLLYLLRRAGTLVTKKELHQAVWRDAAVVEDTLTQSIGELRRLLGDSPRSPRFIETVHRRGFRFIAEVTEWRSVSADLGEARSSLRSAEGDAGAFVGRRRQLEQLAAVAGEAAAGRRQLVFVTGEAGSGKTSLVEEFLRDNDAAGHLVVCGQCVQALGPLEPYMPLLEGLERVLSSPSGRALVPAMQSLAPSWCEQIPWLRGTGGASERSVVAPPRERMLREIAVFLEEISGERTVLLVLEDLHWSDLSTLGLVDYLARRRDPARLLIVGTYRDGDVSTAEHPLRAAKQRLLLQQSCTEVALPAMSLGDVRDYLQRRFGVEIAGLGPFIHERSGGNPLFVVALVDELLRREWLAMTENEWATGAADDAVLQAVPGELSEMILVQLEPLIDSDRALLDVASVAGLVFDPRVVAAALGCDTEHAEERCRTLVQRRLLAPVGHLTGQAGGQAPGHFQFIHPLHRQVIYDQIGSTRSRRLHRLIGEILESMRGDDSGNLAADLSVHFQHAADGRAVHYLAECAERAQGRAAHKEALSYLKRAIALLDRLPPVPDRLPQELRLRLLANVSLNVTRGYASPELIENTDRMRVICRMVDDLPHRFEVAQVRWYACLAGEGSGLEAVLDEMDEIAERLGTPQAQLRARLARGRSSFWRGAFKEAYQLLDTVIEEASRETITFPATSYGIDPLVGARMQLALASWFVGLPIRARRHARYGMARADQSGLAYDQASALAQAALVELLCGDAEEASTLATRGEQICQANEVAFILPLSRVLRGAAEVRVGDARSALARMIDGLRLQQQLNGSFFCHVILGLIADAHGRLGEWEEGIRRADQGIALAQNDLERIYAAELWRIKGVLSSRDGARSVAGSPEQPAPGEAGELIRRALRCSREQGATALELRAATSLLATASDGRAKQRASATLKRILATFSEGFDTADLREARSLLAS